MSLFRRLRARLEGLFESDTAFVERAYRETLGRAVDQDGLNHYRRVLSEGMRRTSMILDLTRSDEFANALKKEIAPAETSRVKLQAIRPERYAQATDMSNGQTVNVFDATGPEDFDWLETAILEHGYYEQPGVWNLTIDTDKRVMAEIIASFAPARALELGCAAGAVLECLADLGVEAEGVEISKMARDRASDRVRARIHLGDLLGLQLEPVYDVVFGLDIFEHLNPNKLDAYLARIVALMPQGGFVFCNVPAFGADRIFGTVFPVYLEGWDGEAAAGKHFSRLHVDAFGFPIHGHLIWADAAWWAERFERQGLRREDAIEHELHRRYDAYMGKRSRARQAYYVFSKHGTAERTAQVVERLRRTRSVALGD